MRNGRANNITLSRVLCCQYQRGTPNGLSSTLGTGLASYQWNYF